MSDSKKKPDNYKVDADDVADEEFEIVDVNGEKGILTLEFDDLVKEQNKNISEIAVASGVILGSTAYKEYKENFIKAKSLLDIFKS